MPKCIECPKSAYFNILGERAQYCVSHKSVDMINVIDKLCTHELCSKRALYNTPEYTSPIFCLTHKLEGMVNLKSKRCAQAGCFVAPIYNLDGESKGLYCIDHKSEEMVNVLGSRCISEEGCSKIAQFNIDGESKGLYCASHKLDDMIDVKHKRCEEPGCTKLPSYKLETDTQPRFCAEHRKSDMIDGKHKKCGFLGGCNKTAGYSNPGESILYCSEHKSNEMVDGKHKMCEYKDCKLRPVYNEIGKKIGRFCASHKSAEMVDVLNKICLSEWCLTQATNKNYEGYCLFCYVNLFPDKPVTRNYKTKEKSVADFILANFPGLTWCIDKKVQDGCSRRRPDLHVDLGYQIIIIEIDENQHINYDCSCENKRLMEISQDMGHRNIVFIRFNPDDYILSDNTKIKSCWKINKHSISCVPKTKTIEWAARLSSLKLQIEYWLKNQTDKMIEIVQLYYNENIE
jgi:hypothetical protein